VEESERELAASAEVAATEKKGQGLNAAFLVSLAARFGDASAPLTCCVAAGAPRCVGENAEKGRTPAVQQHGGAAKIRGGFCFGRLIFTSLKAQFAVGISL
jgi:hypothetical protein